jgi:type VI protein secretion system component VasK
MLFIALLVVFAACAFVTSALAYDQLRWRYAAIITVVCAVLLAAWTAGLLVAVLRWFSLEVNFALALLSGATPYAIVLAGLWRRRRQTPRHTPSLDDDPVLRRHVAEKLRRVRRQRQAEAQEETAANDSTFL